MPRETFHLRSRLATRASLTEIQLAKYQTSHGYDANGASPVPNLNNGAYSRVAQYNEKGAASL
jgi:hypothetical protein